MSGLSYEIFIMMLLVPAEVLCNVWSYNFYDMTLFTES